MQASHSSSEVPCNSKITLFLETPCKTSLEKLENKLYNQRRALSSSMIWQNTKELSWRKAEKKEQQKSWEVAGTQTKGRLDECITFPTQNPRYVTISLYSALNLRTPWHERPCAYLTFLQTNTTMSSVQLLSVKVENNIKAHKKYQHFWHKEIRKDNSGPPNPFFLPHRLGQAPHWAAASPGPHWSAQGMCISSLPDPPVLLQQETTF